MSIYTHEYKERISRSWHTFTQDGTLSDSLIRNVISESWIRSRNYRVNPLEVKTKILSPEELKRRIHQKKSLIDIAHSYMERLYSFVKGSNFVVILTDEEGYIIEMIGDEEHIKSRTKTSNLVIGSNRSEEYAGTNAIGTPLAIDAPLQVWGEEHYVKAHHPFTCSGAPIHDTNGNIIGCLDITGPREKIHLHTLGMVVAAVDGIEKGMAMKNAYEQISLINNQLNRTIESISSGIILLDDIGKITQINKNALNMLKLSYEESFEKNIYQVIENANHFLNLNKNIYNKEVQVQTKNHTSLNFSISTTVVPNCDGTPHGTVIVMNEMKYVHKLVNKMSGFSAQYTFDSIIGDSPEIKEVIKLGRIAAKSSSNILILGESGTGKELIAQSIHNASDRSRYPFIAINCGALPAGLIESELFGYESGAFTGAHKDGQPGKFELANGGTIFLDEIGDMPLNLQVSLLRVLQTKEIVRIGGKQNRKIDVRIIAATNVNLEESIENKTFRNDLYYRLNVFSIHIPALRKRKKDIKTLIQHFIKEKSNKNIGKSVVDVDTSAFKALLNYDWPGNIRELENIIERAICISDGSTITLKDLPTKLCMHQNTEDKIEDTTYSITEEYVAKRNEPSETIPSLNQSEHMIILSALRQTNGNIKKAAQIIGIGRRTLYRKLEKYNIDSSEFRI